MRLLRVVHRWLGLLLAAPLVVLGLTGSILTLEPVWPDWGAPALQGGVPAGADAVLAAAQAVAPEGMRVARYVPGAVPTVYFGPSDGSRGPQMVLRLDPVAAVPIGVPRPADGVVAWVRRLHTTLLVPALGGRQIAGWCGAGLLVLTVLGVPLWWPGGGRMRGGFVVPRGARGVRLHRALHGAAGAWLVAMLLATGVTGMVQGFPQTSRALLGLQAGGPPRPSRAEAGARPPGLAVDRLAVDRLAVDGAVRLAQQALPGTVLRVAMLPASEREPVRLMMAPPGGGGAVATRMVTVQGGVARVQPIMPGEMVMRWAHDLHEGEGVGPVWRGLTVLVGLGLPVFAVRGVAMWVLRRRNRARLAAVRREAMQSGD